MSPYEQNIKYLLFLYTPPMYESNEFSLKLSQKMSETSVRAVVLTHELIRISSLQISSHIFLFYYQCLTPGGFLVQRSIRGRAAEMGLKISLLV